MLYIALEKWRFNSSALYYPLELRVPSLLVTINLPYVISFAGHCKATGTKRAFVIVSSHYPRREINIRCCHYTLSLQRGRCLMQKSTLPLSRTISIIITDNNSFLISLVKNANNVVRSRELLFLSFFLFLFLPEQQLITFHLEIRARCNRALRRRGDALDFAEKLFVNFRFRLPWRGSRRNV